jgi:excisionase family DNA binding protein
MANVASPPVTLMLTPEEAALALRVGRSKVYDLMRAGVLRSVKIGGSRRISVRALGEYVAALERDAA